jgi:histidinol dehydrogenase
MGMRIVHSGTPEFKMALRELSERGYYIDGHIEAVVQKILRDVKQKGDTAVLEYTEHLDGVRLQLSEMEILAYSLAPVSRSFDPQILESLTMAAERIRNFHARQQIHSWDFIDTEGVLLGQKITPLDRVGIYVPGGKAAYPSSVLMNAIPAKLAGVKEIVLVTPPARIEQTPVILGAASICGIDRVFRIGGAQAIAALAYGTERIPKVDKIVGPGNIYVETAKRMVFGQVDIDMIAGPSEVVIITDGTADPSFLAADLLAQAEHDERARPVLISTSMIGIQQVIEELERQMPLLPTHKTASQAIKENGIAFFVDNLDEAAELSNTIAPEHLQLAIGNPDSLLEKIQHAGAIFIDAMTPETMGDYLAGPNHVLPTGGTARFFSPLGVYDFVKRTSILRMGFESLKRLGPVAASIARLEGLEGHARSIDIRLRHQGKVV